MIGRELRGEQLSSGGEKPVLKLFSLKVGREEEAASCANTAGFLGPWAGSEVCRHHQRRPPLLPSLVYSLHRPLCVSLPPVGADAAYLVNYCNFRLVRRNSAGANAGSAL